MSMGLAMLCDGSRGGYGFDDDDVSTSMDSVSSTILGPVTRDEKSWQLQGGGLGHAGGGWNGREIQQGLLRVIDLDLRSSKGKSCPPDVSPPNGCSL